MSRLSTHRNEINSWFWLAFIPVFGGIAIAYAGRKIQQKNWIWVGISLVVASLILSSSGALGGLWFTQIGIAYYMRRQFFSNEKTQANSFSDRKAGSLTGKTQEKIDINTCSKDDLVYYLELPIVYANDIEAVRRQGHIFTHLEELSDLAGLPEKYIGKIADLVTFSYDLNQELAVSWRRLNAYSQEQLVECGLDVKVARKIVEERHKNGSYQSVIEVQRRTGVPLSCYHHLI